MKHAWLLLHALLPLAAEMLHNGIVIETPWPPRGTALPDATKPPPYLASPPRTIPVDVGRQLFVDDFLIEQTTLSRVFHKPDYHPANPVLRPDRPWESETPEQGASPTAMPYSDGVWFDPKDGLFKLWYMCGYGGATCYAESRDGVKWSKPDLDVRRGTNVVIGDPRGSTTVWLDHDEKDPDRRFKFLTPSGGDNENQILRFSRDGIHWSSPVRGNGMSGDRSTFFFNPFRNVWVFSIKMRVAGARARQYRESGDVVAGASWRKDEPVPWAGADRLDPPRADLAVTPQLYNLDATPYESILLGLFAFWRGQPDNRPKPNELHLGYSRDGFHWQRPDRTPFLAPSERRGDWNWGNIQSAGGGLLIAGDKLYFYVSGRAGEAANGSSGVCSTGLATLRRDGFASMRASGSPGVLTTRPLTFTGRHLFVNASAPRGEIRVEALDEDGRTLAGYSKERCIPVRGDATMARVQWKDKASLNGLDGRRVRFRFHVSNGDLFSFWVSREASGASRGYAAAGGPGFAGARDGDGLETR
ncbi:MAG: glycosyl hydrolase family 32 [Acidobacteria bacterium]|nr:glycosyl hydrolase family 32 [Acidobacteriota bacterium]